MTDFGQEIERLAEKYKKRMRAVAKESVQQTVEIAQEIGLKSDASAAAIAKAASLGGGKGRMRVLTGFLRASIAGNVGSMPSGESENMLKPPEKVEWDGDAISAAITRWNPEKGETIYVGWTANYARHRESRDGFMRGAVEVWDQTVHKVAQKVKASI